MVEQGTHKPLDVSSNLTLATISFRLSMCYHRIDNSKEPSRQPPRQVAVRFLPPNSISISLYSDFFSSPSIRVTFIILHPWVHSTIITAIKNKTSP